MKAYHIDRFGSVGGIARRSSEDPRPGPKEILMRVCASSLNYRDLMVLKGGGRGPTKIGVVPLSDGGGEVAAIGEGVSRVKIGDRIAGCFHPRWFGGPIKPEYLTDRLGANLDGMLAEYAVFNEEAVVHLPSHLSFEEAATLPCAAVTAWVALTGHRGVTAGDTVLIQGSGGVSVFALQFARVLGARVIATTSTAEKAKRLQALGASDVINYTETPDWDTKVRELTDGRGVDCMVEIGGPGTIAVSLKALAVGGHVSLIGASLSSSGTGLDPLLLTGRGITLGSISVGSRADFEAMNRAIALHRLRPAIDRTFPFAEAKIRRVLGARVIATTSTAEKAKRLQALGASDVINYTETPDWDTKVRELTDGRGVDCMVEIGGPGTIAMSLKALAVGGHVSLIGASLSSSGTGLDPLLLTGRGITLGSISVGSRADFEAMNRAIALHRLRPAIDRTFPFAEAKIRPGLGRSGDRDDFDSRKGETAPGAGGFRCD